MRKVRKDRRPASKAAQHGRKARGARIAHAGKAWAATYAQRPRVLAAVAMAAAMAALALHYGRPGSAAEVWAWSVAFVAAGLLAGWRASLAYRDRKANPYARLRLAREPRFDMPRMGPRATELAAGEPVIRIAPCPARKPQPGEWSIDLLRSLEWKRFGLLCAAYYRHRQFRVESADCGAKQGTDARLFFKNLQAPVALMHCRAWGGRVIGVQPLRELADAMAGAGIPKGIFHCASDYTNEARAFAAANRIRLVTGPELVLNLGELPDAVRRTVLDLVTEGDYTTPTCPACGKKMALHGTRTGDVWACSGFPQCRATLQVHASW